MSCILIFEECYGELENMMNVHRFKLVELSRWNDKCSHVQTLEKIVVAIVKDPNGDEVEDDSTPLEAVM